MSSFSRPPSGRTSRSEVRTISSPSESNRERTVKRQSSFSEGGRRLSEGETARTTNTTGVRTVNRVMGIFNRDISSSPVGRHGLIVSNTQSELESGRESIIKKLANAREKLSIMKKKPKTALSNINKQLEIIKVYEYKLREYTNAMKKVEEAFGRKRVRRESNNVKTSELKRTKSTEEPPTISTKPPTTGVLTPTPVKKSSNFLSELTRVTGKINRSQETVVETQVPTKKTQTPTKKTQTPTKKTQTPTKKTQTPTKKTQKPSKKTPVKPPKTKNQETQTNFISNIKMGTTVQRALFPNSSEGSDNKTPTTKTTKTKNPPSIKEQYYKAKLEGAIEASKERQERRKREGTPRARRSLEPIFNKMAKSPKTPPGITKTNLQQFLAPFKQPVSIQFAPSIKATGGTGGNATVIQIKNKKNDDKKKKPIKKFDVLADPASAYRKSVVASKRKEIMTKLRTPTVGQRKKHVIQLIDKELRKMKVPKDIERKMISLYSKVLSEKQIKQLFGGRSTGDVKKILKKQVDYFKKKKR